MRFNGDEEFDREDDCEQAIFEAHALASYGHMQRMDKNRLLTQILVRYPKDRRTVVCREADIDKVMRERKKPRT